MSYVFFIFYRKPKLLFAEVKTRQLRRVRRIFLYHVDRSVVHYRVIKFVRALLTN